MFIVKEFKSNSKWEINIILLRLTEREMNLCSKCSIYSTPFPASVANDTLSWWGLLWDEQVKSSSSEWSFVQSVPQQGGGFKSCMFCYHALLIQKGCILASREQASYSNSWCCNILLCGMAATKLWLEMVHHNQDVAVELSCCWCLSW